MQPENRTETGQFRRGQSGNPGGRPKSHPEFRQQCRDFMDSKGWGLLKKVASTPGRHQVLALPFIAEQGCGRAAQAVVEQDSGPMEVIVRYVSKAGPLMEPAHGEATDPKERA